MHSRFYYFLLIALCTTSGTAMATNQSTVFPPMTMDHKECGEDQLRVLSWSKGVSSTICLTGQEVLAIALPNCADGQQVIKRGTTFMCETTSLSIPSCTKDQRVNARDGKLICETDPATGDPNDGGSYVVSDSNGACSRTNWKTNACSCPADYKPVFMSSTSSAFEGVGQEGWTVIHIPGVSTYQCIPK